MSSVENTRQLNRLKSDPESWSANYQIVQHLRTQIPRLPFARSHFIFLEVHSLRSRLCVYVDASRAEEGVAKSQTARDCSLIHNLHDFIVLRIPSFLACLEAHRCLFNEYAISESEFTTQSQQPSDLPVYNIHTLMAN